MINLSWWKVSTKISKWNNQVQAINQRGETPVQGIYHMEDNRIIQCLDWTIDFIEAAIMRVSILALTIGAILGTIEMLAPQFHLSAIPWYNMMWAIVQAIALDGLLVGVLFLLRDNWKVYDKPTKIYYGAIALLLGIVAALVNCTLAYQEVHQIPDVVDAMSQLHISSEAFAYTRAILVVLVTGLVCTLPRRRVIPCIPEVEPSDIQSTNEVEEKVDIYTKIFEERLAVLLQETVTSEIDKLYSVFQIEAPKEQPLQLSKYDRIREYIELNPNALNKDISQELDIPLTTVKSYAAKVRKEDRITDSITTV